MSQLSWCWTQGCFTIPPSVMGVSQWLCAVYFGCSLKGVLQLSYTVYFSCSLMGVLQLSYTGLLRLFIDGSATAVVHRFTSAGHASNSCHTQVYSRTPVKLQALACLRRPKSSGAYLFRASPAGCVCVCGVCCSALACFRRPKSSGAYLFRASPAGCARVCVCVRACVCVSWCVLCVCVVCVCLHGSAHACLQIRKSSDDHLARATLARCVCGHRCLRVYGSARARNKKAEVSSAVRWLTPGDDQSFP